MPGIAVIHASSHGHTAAIAERIAEDLRAHGLSANVFDVRKLPHGFFLPRYDAVVLGGRVHQGQVPRKLRKFIRQQASALRRIPSAFFTVSLSMAGRDEAAKQVIRQLTARVPAEAGWRPSISAAFAGALPYTRYGLVLRWVMRRISAASGGETDTSRDYVYTDWDDVRRFALELAGRATAHVAAALDEVQAH
jgi:menaquinone-dependent protoporphyrinogen oxidase